MKKIKKAIIPVAGNGTRFLPFTKAVPKEMLPIISTPTLNLIVDEAVNSGIEEIFFITSEVKPSITKYFERNHTLEQKLFLNKKEHLLETIIEPTTKAKFHWIQQDNQLGLGHAVSLASKYFEKDEAFALLLGDDVIYTADNELPALKQLMEVYNKTQSSVLGVQKVPYNEVHKYGIVDLGNKIDTMSSAWEMKNIVEKPSADLATSNYAIIGRYVLESSIFKHLNSKEFKNNEEIQITDSIFDLLKENKQVLIKEINGERYDMGSKLGFIKAQIEFSLRDPELREEVLKLIKNIN